MTRWNTPFFPFLMLAALSLSTAAQPVRLSITPPGADGWARLSSTGPTGRVYHLEVSGALADWEETARVHRAFQGFPDLETGTGPARFYRARLTPPTPADDWKNQAWYGDDPFRSPEAAFLDPEPRWIKFALLLDQPHRVYFQDSAKYPFHYEFAVARLPGFNGMTRAQFDAVSLRTNGQQVVLGAVLFAPGPNLAELGLQFVGLDPYPPEQVAAWYRTVRAMIATPPEVNDYYLPTFEQAGVAQQNLAYLAARGVKVSSSARWVIGDACYAGGWALGRLVFVPAADIPAAYADGRLRPADILLTDAVPAEIPPVAGVIALTPATPNSHVALLARSFGIPFVYFADPAARERVRQLDGREVALRAIEQFAACALAAVDIEGQLTPAQRTELLALKTPPVLNIPSKQPRGAISVSVEGLRPSDIRFVGGKAANFGLLRQSIPTYSPTPAIAFTFDLWDAYLAQTLPGGLTLGAAIQQRLGGYDWPPDMAALRADLAAVRDLVDDTVDFTPPQRAAILAALQDAGFDADRNIRFRSSTNVEDGEQFSGAGLYDSYSGCLADDLDGDNAGPSVCDPTEPRERGVFRALRKVYASFYNDNAFLERLRHGVDEATVGMGVLVHHSTPDPFELANGVATLRVTRGTDWRFVEGQLVTQQGAVSVANPDSTARPETVQASSYNSDDPFLTVQEHSSLVTLGATVLGWETEYRQLFRLLTTAARAYESEFPAKTDLLLDFEYKKVEPGGALRIKQIREIPRPDRTSTVTPFLVSATNPFVVFQGEHGDLIANHRLKSAWSFGTRTAWLAASNLNLGILLEVEGRYLENLTPASVSGPVAALPGHHFRRIGETLENRWDAGTGATARRFALRQTPPPSAAANAGPIITLNDVRLELSVEYAAPQFTIDFTGLNARTTNETVLLHLPLGVTAESLRQERQHQWKGVNVRTSFYWPPPPKGPTAGYTAPLAAWIGTTITGLASRPLELRSDNAQTYRPGHHNFVEDFVFDPHLEPGLDAALLAELTARNIRALVVSGDPWGGTSSILVWGLDGRFRPL